MKPHVLLAAFIGVVGCASAPPRASPPPPQAEVSLEVFDDALAVYGEWTVVPRHGRVWRPMFVAAGWQPYRHGEWVWTADGWFWLTDEPWGWATYHYGRWAYEPALGWVWVPGLVWAPAWVAWRVGDDFVGWAPLYPGYDVWWAESYPLEPPHWIFVPTSSFVAVRIELVAVPNARVAALVRSSRPAPPPSSRWPSPAPAPAPRFGGPAREVVERHVGRPIAPARVVAVPTPGDARRRSEPGAVPVYRPAPGAARARPAAAPAPARPEPAPAAPARRAPQAAPVRERAPAAAPATRTRAAPAPKAPPAPRKTEEEEGKPPAPARPGERG